MGKHFFGEWGMSANLVLAVIVKTLRTKDNNKKQNHMRKIISFMHISLDGFVAGLNGEIGRAHV